MQPRFASILAATDLGSGSDAIVRSAALLAARSGAELHLLHSLELPWVPSADVTRRSGFSGQIEAAEERLRDQVRRTMPEGISPTSQQVIIYLAHKAILDRAEEVAADLIVVGPHRGGPAGAHFLGTTADRVIRTARVPCLVVDEPLTERTLRIGVPIDCSDPSQGALQTALAWGTRVAESAAGERERVPEVRIVSVGWPVEREDNPEMEETIIRPQITREVKRAVSRVPGAQALEIGVDVRWAEAPSEAILGWAQREEIDLLVLGTHGLGGLKRALIGSTASRIARRPPCPVLLVPPSLWSGEAHAPRLERVLIATDFSESSVEAARWSVRHLAPRAEHLLLHVIEVPEPPAVLAGRFGSREELLRTARTGAERRIEEARRSLAEQEGSQSVQLRTEVREGESVAQIVGLAAEADVDLLVVGEHGPGELRRGGWTMLGTAVERILRASPAPVLVGRGLRPHPPQRLLVAVDGSAASLRALSWAEFLRECFGASVSVLYVESPFAYGQAYGYAAMASTNVPPAEPCAAHQGGRQTGWTREREDWLREQVRRSGIDPDDLSIQVAIGSPATEIVVEEGRSDADLILMGTHGRGTLGRTLLGSVAGAVLRTASCPVLVVADPERARV